MNQNRNNGERGFIVLLVILSLLLIFAIVGYVQFVLD